MQIDVKAAKTLLREGVALGIKPPLLLFWWRPAVYQPCVMQLVLMNKYLSLINISNEELEDITIAQSTGLLAKHIEQLTKVVAVCMFRNYTASKWLHGLVAKWLMRKCSADTILQIVEHLAIFGGTSDFMSITRFLNSFKILGQMTNRS